MFWRISLVFLVLIVSSCVSTPQKKKPHKIISESEFLEKYPTALEFRERIGNTTRSSHNYAHGTQIEFHAANGRSYLWYPGNNTIVPALWRIAEGSERIIVHVQTASGVEVRKAVIPEICYLYPGSSFNPVTNQRGGGWDCRSIKRFRYSTVESRKGDVFGLSRSAFPPFILTNDRTTIDAILARCKKC